MNAFAYFQGTDLKLRRDGSTRIYRIQELSGFPDFGRGLEIDLTNSFELSAQNSNATLVLGVDIRDRSGNIVYQDQVGQYGVIRVSN